MTANSLIKYDALIGCDITSVFSGKGKLVEALKSNDKICKTMTEIGNTFAVSVKKSIL